MKNIITTAIFLLLLFPMVYAQTQQPPTEKFDQYVDQVFTGEGVTFFGPETLNYRDLKKMYEERIYFATYDATTIEAKGYENLSSVPLFTVFNDTLVRDEVFNFETFNPLKYYFDYHTKSTQVYVLGTTNKVLIIYPQTITQ